jgi:hypothetical protein
MTLSAQTTRVKRLARVSSNSVTVTNTDDVVMDYINEGVREFCKLVNGIPAEDYLTVAPVFDSRTNWAIRITTSGGTANLAAEDVAITTTNRTNVAGATIASDLQATIRSAIGGDTASTVAFTTSGDNLWTFLITPKGSPTSISIEAPEDNQYVDARAILFGSADSTQTAATWRSGIGQDAIVETALPTTFLEMEFVEWGKYRLSRAPYELFISPESSGRPSYYAVKNDRIRVYPSPTSQELFHIRYKQAFADLDTNGDDNSVTCPLPANEHMAPVYYSVSKLMEEKQQFGEARNLYGEFYRMATTYKVRENNQNPTLFPSYRVFQPPNVNVDQTGGI